METQPGKSPRIFRNSILEALTRTSPQITVVHYSAISILLTAAGHWLAHDSFGNILVYLPAGIFFWTFFEYVMHRYLFHIDDYIKWAGRFQYIMHGVHHNHPKDESRIFMPPVPGLLITVLLLGMNWLVFRGHAFYFTAGMITGYLGYACIHYSVHTQPRRPGLRKLWQHHALHHYRYPDKAFGVSSPLWDIVFGTMPPNEVLSPGSRVSSLKSRL
jgi:sterol desaturase/sphingolipid hydroxylase (fatty acid hydroxylase superfamily)